jgi:hypothetical protein
MPDEFQAKGLGLELFVVSLYFMPVYDGKKSSRPGTFSKRPCFIGEVVDKERVNSCNNACLSEGPRAQEFTHVHASVPAAHW